MLSPTHIRIGYSQTAPACGDCAHSADNFTALVCRKHHIKVEDGAHCASWSPDANWLNANPAIAAVYEAPLSASERHYLQHEHVL